jgi:hypothetical protein
VGVAAQQWPGTGSEYIVGMEGGASLTSPPVVTDTIEHANTAAGVVDDHAWEMSSWAWWDNIRQTQLFACAQNSKTMEQREVQGVWEINHGTQQQWRRWCRCLRVYCVGYFERNKRMFGNQRHAQEASGTIFTQAGPEHHLINGAFGQ